MGLVIMRLFAGTEFDQPPKCKRCGALEADCTCRPPPAARISPQSQTARLSVAKRQRGKVVTVIQGLAAAGNDLPELLRQLKSHCGAGGTLEGGTLEGGTLEIQGDHRDRIRAALGVMGFRVKG
jgi:translation initiation factor 1